MKIGIVSMYPYRPHVQDLVYLSNQIEKEGHTCYFLTCRGSLPTCYYNLFKGKEKSIIQCLKCYIGGISAYKNYNTTTIDKNIKTKLEREDILYIINSTIGSLGRIENESELETIVSKNIKQKLIESAEIVYQNTVNWISRENLDGVLLFNGRLDVTRSIMLALKKNNIPFISVENHLNGITLNYNEDCLSLDFINAINMKYRDVYLNEQQATFAGVIIGEMFLKKQKLWRTHNIVSVKSEWPIKNIISKKILITPSSKYEFLGNEDWKVHWTRDYTEGYEKVIRALGVDFRDCVLRCHPFWNENIGKVGKGDKSETHYKTWARLRGIHVVESKNEVNTLDLIREADIVLVNGGTAGIEAALLGKTVISIGKSRYYQAGFTINVFNENDLRKILPALKEKNQSLIQHRAIRYIYNYHGRFEQFYDVISRQTPLKNCYHDSKKLSHKIIRFFEEEKIEPYDIDVSNEKEHETKIASLINENNWEALVSLNSNHFSVNNCYEIRKKGILKIVDMIREKLPAGHY